MANIYDVAKYILNTIGDVSTMKLQKLCFYAQAIKLAEHGTPIFEEEFEAWANGPVSRELFAMHKGKFIINTNYIRNELLTGELTQEDIICIDKCLEMFGDAAPHELSEKTHLEQPWMEARGNVPEGINCSKVIPKRSIKEYYSAQFS